MSQELKIGDTVQINKVDAITLEIYPAILGKHVTITGFTDTGLATFKDNTPAPADSIYQRHDKENMSVDTKYGWEYEVVS